MSSNQRERNLRRGSYRTYARILASIRICPEFPLRNLIPKITGNKGSFILKDLSNPLYGLDQEDGKKESV